MKTPDNIISIWGVPRSGTSWLGQIFNSSPHALFRYQPLFSYGFKNRLSNCSTKKEIEEFFADIIKTNDSFVINGTAPKIEIELLSFNKTKNPTHLVMKHVRYMHIIKNLLLKTNNVKVVAIIRHPCATINSWIQSPKEFNPSWKISDEWITAKKKNNEEINQYFGFEKWKEATMLFEQLNKDFPKKVFLIKYSELLINTAIEVDNLFRNLSLEFSNETMDFINKSRSINFDNRSSVFKNKKHDNGWKTELHPSIVEQIINDLSGTSLNKYL